MFMILLPIAYFMWATRRGRGAFTNVLRGLSVLVALIYLWSL
jgi:hypothetical protein